MKRRVIATLGVLGAAGIGAALWHIAFSPIPELTLGKVLVISIGFTFVVSGLGAWMRRPENRTGIVLVLAGFAWWNQTLLGSRVAILFTIASAFETLVIPFLFWLFLSFPEARLATQWRRVLFIYSIVLTFLVSTAFSPFYDPAAFGCPNCQKHLNLFLIHSSPRVVNDAGNVTSWMIVAGMVLLIGTMAAIWFRSTKPRKRVLAPVFAPGTTWSFAYLLYLLLPFGAGHGIYAAPQITYTITANIFLWSLLLLPVTFVIGLTRYRARRARVSDLVLELGELPSSQRLEDALRRTLGDPSLRVGFAIGDRYLSIDGSTLELPDPIAAQTTLFLERDGEPMAVIVHDKALLDDPGLLDAVAAASRLAVENERLQAEVRSQLAQVRASRSRIVAAADEERRRVERNLHDGAQSRLVSLSLALQLAQSQLDGANPDVRSSLVGASEELNRAISELRDLARGIHPSALAESGLAAAIESLAERAPIPVRLAEVTENHFPERAEAAAYFVTSEAITNAVRHARASEILIRIREVNGSLEVEVLDDGVGGASLEGGTGLRGLADRVEALDGTLSVDSPAGRGTKVVARIPCG